MHILMKIGGRGRVGSIRSERKQAGNDLDPAFKKGRSNLGAIQHLGRRGNGRPNITDPHVKTV